MVMLLALLERRFLVSFVNGIEKACASAMLSVEKAHTILPPDLPLSTAQIEHQAEDDEAQEALLDQEEEEHVSAESLSDDKEESCW
jgi:hypothetical protein